jgi:uncharacterized membrane protein
VLLAWAILHLSYAERHAQLHLHADEPPFGFPETAAPTLLEFVDFSFTVGTTFATSDIEVRPTRMRGIVLCHGLLAFVYNTAITGRPPAGPASSTGLRPSRGALSSRCRARPATAAG